MDVSYGMSHLAIVNTNYSIHGFYQPPILYFSTYLPKHHRSGVQQPPRWPRFRLEALVLRGGATGSRLQREANATRGDVVVFFHGRNVEDGMFLGKL